MTQEEVGGGFSVGSRGNPNSKAYDRGYRDGASVDLHGARANRRLNP
jgi:hypothetical protein